MGELGNLMREAFGTCTVNGNIVKFSKSYTPEELRMIHSQFTTDLLDYNIPHYRVVGIKYEIERDDRRVLRLSNAYGMTIVELGLNAQQMIPAAIGGTDIEKGCLVRESDSLEGAPETMVSDVGEDAMRVFSRHAAGYDFGQIMHMSYYADSDDDNNIMTGKSMRYCQMSARDTVKPDFLVDDFKICTVSDEDREDYNYWTIFFYVKGTGERSYSDNTVLFTPKSKVFPCNTIYDLTSVFFCKTLDLDYLDRIELMPVKKYNDSVLTGILREYGGEFSEH